MSLVMRLKIPDAPDMFGIGITVGGCGERAVASDPCHPLIETAIDLPPFRTLRKRLRKNGTYHC